MLKKHVSLNKRTGLWVLGGCAFFVAAMAALDALGIVNVLGRGGGRANGAGSPTNAAESLLGGPPEALYMNGTSLVVHDIEEGGQRVVEEFDTLSLFAAPGSEWVALQTSAEVEGEEPRANPVINVFRPDQPDQKVEAGLGVAPVWNASGTRLAYLAPVDPHRCRGESCPGPRRVGIFDVAAGETEQFLEPSDWFLVGWAGDRIMAYRESDLSKTVFVSAGGGTSDSEVAPLDIVAGSPDGRWLLLNRGDEARFVEIGEEPLAKLDLDGGRLQSASWAHDSRRVAVVVRKGQDTFLMTATPARRTVQPVDQGLGVRGTPLWSPDNGHLLVARARDEGLLQAAYCPADSDGSCRILFSWTGAARLLRVQ